MTRLRGASLDSPDVARAARGNEHAQFYRCKIPPNAPEVVVQNTVDVSDPSRVLPWYRDERRRRFNILVRKYKRQLLYGCQDPGCRTPTCASHRKRVSEGPYRRYTELSARTLACYLASLDDAEDGLCCNNPRPPTEIAMQEYHRLSLQRSRAFHAQAAAVTAEDAGLGDQGEGNPLESGAKRDGLQTKNGAVIEDSSSQPSGELQLQDFDYAREQRLKDPKSFTQNLFDTISLRMVEWLPLRRPPDTLHSKSQPPPPTSVQSNNERRPDRDTAQTENAVDGQAPQPFVSANPRTPSSRTQPSVELRFQNQHVTKLSVTEVDHFRHSLDEKKRPNVKNRKMSMSSVPLSNDIASMPSPPALKHRPQKHRGRIEDIGSTGVKDRNKNKRRVSWDGEKVLGAIKESQDGPLPRWITPEYESPCHRKAKHSVERHQGPLAQTVTHLSSEIIDGLRQIMVQSDEEAENWRHELDRIQFMGNFETPDWQFATSRQRQVFPFVAQSVFYVFSSAGQILRSFERIDHKAITARLDVSRLQVSLQRLFTLCPWEIALHSLWSTLEKLFVPPEELASRRSSSRSPGQSAPPVVMRRPSEETHLSDADAAYVATVAFFTLASSVPELDANTWRGIIRMRATGAVASSADMHRLSQEDAQRAVEVTDKLEHELGLRLVNRLVRGLAARLAYHEISKAYHRHNHDPSEQRKVSVLDRVVENLTEHYSLAGSIPAGPIPLIVEWLRTLFLREWDGNPEVPRGSAAGGAIQILASMYKERNRLGLVPEDFHSPILASRLDPLEMPMAWVGSLSNNRTIHLLSYPFLFPPSSLVIFFRALNYSAMTKYYESAMTTTRHVTQTAFGAIQINDDGGLLARLKTSMSTYLVLVVRRDNVLTDALNQLWRREKRELMRPLKVQMGMDEGEEGLDHGGVQQEFFRVLMAEALDMSYGMFTMDLQHRISWFQARSLEPLYKFELLGLLMSIAVYNGLTLPINFPLAFYRKLLGLKVKRLDHIRDGWPELAHGLETLLAWKEGDVADVFMRTYEFSFESFGRVETVDMQKVGRDAIWPLPDKMPSQTSTWSDTPHHLSQSSSCVSEAARLTGQPLPSPTAPTDEASLVSNHNRHKFVKDYIFWLTDKSIRPQFESFARGFGMCLDRSALSIFTPEALKTVIEGIQEIDVEALEKHARYEGGFGPDHRVIRDFWGLIRQYPSEKKAHLLEFVTASDRVPVNGISSIMFVIQKNGVGDLRLPTSLTCFGRLLLPEYSSKVALAEKLDKALENAQGFGVA